MRRLARAVRKTRGAGMVIGAVVALLAGCSGSASESPWPVEPIDIEPAPVGEQPGSRPNAEPQAPERESGAGGGPNETAPESP